MENKDFLVETHNGAYYCANMESLARKVTALKAIGALYRVIYLDENENPVVMMADPLLVANGCA